MKKMTIMLAIVMMFSMVFSNQAYAMSSYEIVLAKHSLANAHAAEYIEGYNETAGAEIRNNRVAELICNLQSNLLQENEVNAELEQLGVYKLETDLLQSDVSVTSSEPADVIINNVQIYYDSYTDEWLVSGGGYWVDDSAWQSEFSGSVFDAVGDTINIGGYDCAGIMLYNTSGTYNTQVVRSYLQYSDGNGNVERNQNPSTFDASKGQYFLFQDKACVIEKTFLNPTYSYMGRHFAVMIYYDGNFSNFNGYARTEYKHTWMAGAITGVSFGDESSLDNYMNHVTYEIEFEEYSFTAYSTGEKKF